MRLSSNEVKAKPQRSSFLEPALGSEGVGKAEGHTFSRIYPISFGISLWQPHHKWPCTVKDFLPQDGHLLWGSQGCAGGLGDHVVWKGSGIIK